jgi:hypothetical protein
MKIRFALYGIMALFIAAPIHTARAQEDSALLDALVKKGVLSDKEAEDVRASEEKEYNSTAASKITLSSSIKSITFYGDLRLRYELRDGTVAPGDVTGNGKIFTTSDSQTRSRWRFRLRFGVMGNLYDNFFYGIRLSTGESYGRSQNVTFGNADSGGNFSNVGSLLAVDRVYLGWKPTDYLTLTGGKFANPLYTTSMVWDDTISPTGAAEQFDKTFDNVEVFATAGQYIYGDSADNGAFATPASAASAASTGINSNYSDIFMFAEQVGFKYNFDKDTFFKGAASFYTYSGTMNGDKNGSVAGLYSSSPFNLSGSSFGTPSGATPGSNISPVQENNSPSYFTGPFVGAASASETNVTGIDDLAVLETPMEFDFKIGPGSVTTGDPKDPKSVVTTTGWSIPMRVFGDFAYNFDADGRSALARDAITAAFNSPTGTGNTGVTGTGAKGSTDALITSGTGFQGVLHSGTGFLDQAAYQVGVEAGSLKKKGDWDGKFYWQSTGYYALDPNLIGADAFNAATNMEGEVVSVSHNWTDGVSSTLTYAHGTPVNNKMATPNPNQDLQLSDIHQYNLFQADLMWKF